MIHCEKHDLEVTGCSRQLGEFRDEVCEQCIQSIAADAEPIRQRWIERVEELREEYSIEVGERRDEVSARRIAILMTEAFAMMFTGKRGVVELMPIIEKDHFALALQNKLCCDPLPREERVKPELRRRVLTTWGVDRVSGMEGSTCNLKEWTASVLLNPKRKEKKDGNGQGNPLRENYIGGRAYEDMESEEVGRYKDETSIGPSLGEDRYQDESLSVE
jgi:hypothetical protein